MFKREILIINELTSNYALQTDIQNILQNVPLVLRLFRHVVFLFRIFFPGKYFFLDDICKNVFTALECGGLKHEPLQGLILNPLERIVEHENPPFYMFTGCP